MRQIQIKTTVGLHCSHISTAILTVFIKKKIKLEGKMEGEKRGEWEEKGGRGKKEEGREESFRLTILVTF